MHKIFSSSFFLNEISSYSSTHTNTVTARVCRAWFTPSIRFIWDTATLKNALSLLSPFDAASYINGPINHRQPPPPQSWDRFFLYSKYIRDLQCFDTDYSALKRAIFWRPPAEPFFPTLTMLCWDGLGRNVEHLLPLLTPALQRLDLSLDTIPKPMIDGLWKTIAMRLSSLRVLELDIPFKRNHAGAISNSLDESVSRLAQLTLVYLPTYFMTPALFETLSRLPNLRNLSLFVVSKNSRFSNQYVEANVKRKILAGTSVRNFPPFHSLKEFSIVDNLDNQTFTIFDALEHGIKLLKVVYLTCSPCCECSAELTGLMESVHVVCPNLQTITIHGSRPHLPRRAINALLKCSRLHKLDSHRMADLVMEDIVTIATSRSFWQTLRLPSANPLSLQALVPFARSCPDLVTLGLTLDGDLPFSGPDTEYRFSSLRTLNVGPSALTPPSTIEAGIFLSSICDGPLKINSERKYASSWKTVEKIVNSTDATSVTVLVQTLNKEIIVLQDSISKLENMKRLRYSSFNDAGHST